MDLSQFLSQFTRLVSVPPGDLVYHLVILFAIEAILMMAIGEGRRSGWKGASLRMTLAAGGLLLTRGVLAGTALLSAAGLVNSAWIAPPLERAAFVISLGLLAWAFLPIVDTSPPVALALLIVNLMGGVILGFVFASQWYPESQLAGTFYNATLADTIWNVWAAALAALALVAAVIRRNAQGGMLFAALGLLLLSHLLHLFMADTRSNIAGWVRLAELCAYLILVGLMVSRAVEREEPPAPSAATTPWTVIEVCQRVADASNLNVALQRAAVAMSNVLGTDTLALGLLNEVGDTVELAAVYRVGSPPRSGPTFDLASQLPIQSAVSRQHPVVVSADQESQRATLAALVGGAVGSLWVQPLIHQRTAVGVLVASRPHMASGWTISEMQTLNGLCGVLAAALLAAYKAAALSRQVDELRIKARDQETALSQAQTEAQRWSAQLMQERKSQAAARSAKTAQPEAARPEASQMPPVAPLIADRSAPRGRFFSEATRHLQQLDDSRGRLAISPGNQDAMVELLRAAYSLKEAAGMTGYKTLSGLAGALADALQRVKDSQQPVTVGLLALVGESVTKLRTLLGDAQASRSPSVDISPLLGRLAALGRTAK